MPPALVVDCAAIEFSAVAGEKLITEINMRTAPSQKMIFILICSCLVISIDSLLGSQ